MDIFKDFLFVNFTRFYFMLILELLCSDLELAKFI